MNDRQFLRLLAIVVATGLAVGLVAFRASRSGDPVAGGVRGPASASAAASNGAAPAAIGDPAAGDKAPDGLAVENTGAVEPATPMQDPPAMRGAANMDPPGTAVTNEPQGAPAAGGPSPAGSPQ